MAAAAAAVKESWNSRMGVILAVSGSAVGLGNFLRFPGQAAQYGGGAFMLAYFFAFLLIGLPICWAEWTMGRLAGQKGFNSCPGILNAIVSHPGAKYLGVIGVIIPVIIYFYYVIVEAWCLGYSVNFLAGNMKFGDSAQASAFFGYFTGIESNGSAIGFGIKQVGVYLFLVFLLNFFLIYRGLAKGIELFCKYAMPTLILLAIVILIRVLTLGAPNPANLENNVYNGLGFMWNPQKVEVQERKLSEDPKKKEWIFVEEVVGKAAIEAKQLEVEKDPNRKLITVSIWQQLRNPELWLAAAGQIFFSLSVGFGIILTYSSYLSSSDDVVLSGLAATSANEFCEVALGGLITIPAAVAFLGISGIAGNLGTFALGFNVLPLVFSEMPFGSLFGFLFFFLLFLAAVTSSISMLQPGIAFLEESLEINRRQSVAILGLITAFGCCFVVYFSKDIKALDTIDFWAANFLIFILATIQIIIFGWVLGVEKGMQEAHIGAALKIPAAFKFVIKYICPIALISIFSLWLYFNVFGFGTRAVSDYVVDLIGGEESGPNLVAQLSVFLILTVAAFTLMIVSSVKRYQALQTASK